MKWIEFHDDEELGWMCDPLSQELRRGWVRLQKMPRGVVVSFDGVDAALGFDESDRSLVLVPASAQDWHFKTRTPPKHPVWDGSRWVTKPVSVPVKRHQVRLYPERVMTTQAVQGRTCETLLAHLGKSPRMSESEYWFNVYVMLSRAPALDPENLMLFELPDRAFFEAGPPAHFVKALCELRDLEEQTRSFAHRVREYLHSRHNWPAEGDRVRPAPPDQAAATSLVGEPPSVQAAPQEEVAAAGTVAADAPSD